MKIRSSVTLYFVKQNLDICFTSYYSENERSDYMAQVMVNFRMDEELKKSMEQVCKEMGLGLTTAFTMFAAKVSKERRIPFEVAADPVPNAETLKAIEEVRKMKKNPSLGKSYTDVDQMMKELLA